MDKQSFRPACCHYDDEKALVKMGRQLKKLLPADTVVVCIGSDRVIADCLGPVVGSFLAQSAALPVYGTLENPVHKENLSFHMDMIRQAHPGAALLIVDAASAVHYEVGDLVLVAEGVKAGSAVSDITISVGHYSILGVTVQTDTEGRRTTLRLSTVMAIAKSIASTVLYAAGKTYKLTVPV